MLLNISELCKSFGTEKIIENASFEIGEKDKIGLIGINGAGKTTLFKIINDEEKYEKGQIFRNKDLKIGVVRQHMDFIDTEKSITEIVTEVFEPVILIENELKKINEEISHNPENIYNLIEKQTGLNEKYESLGGLTYKSRVKSSLIGMGFSENELNSPFSILSGGQKTRVMLTKILLSDCNLMLLDEPTNHLDIKSTIWLENFLNDSDKAYIVISHDRYFLDKVTQKTMELSNAKISLYNGNYSKYIVLKETEQKTITRKYERTQKEINRLEGIIEQQKRWNREKNIRTAENKQKSIDRLKSDMETPEKCEEEIQFEFETSTQSGNDVLICDKLKMGFNGNTLFSDADIIIKKGEKVFLLGPNGCGKTTLIKLIMNEQKQLSGTIKLGSNVIIGYYDQAQQHLDMQKCVFDEIADTYPKFTQTKIRNALAAFLFKGDSVFKTISCLSGGERARIAILKLLLSSANFLILDEPTNHLDIKSREALENALKSYNGTIFAVSHDRYFINKLAQKIYYMGKDGFKKYDGNYDYFKEHFTNSDDNEKQLKPKTEKGLDYKEQKLLAAKIRKKENTIKKLEQQIFDAEQEIDELKEKILLPEIATDFVKAMEINKKIEEKNSYLEELYSLWEKESE